jgi:transposase-like protein
MERTRRGGNRSEYWRALIVEQEQSGLPVARFCKERGMSEQSFYVWRKRLRKEGPVRFALVEPGLGQQRASATSTLVEVIFPGGEQLRVGAGVNADVLRAVVEALRR